MSQRLFDECVSYFQIMRQDDPNCDLKINIGINIGQHDIFYGLVILLNIFKII